MDRLATVILSTSNRLSKILRNTRYVTSAMVFLCVLVNLVVVFNNAEQVPKALQTSWNRTYTCYEPKHFFFIWDIVHIVMYSLLPFAIILCENVILTCLARKHAKRMRDLRNLSTVSSYPKGGPQIILDQPKMPGEIIEQEYEIDGLTRNGFIER